ncbi:N-formylglutamate amidohydrolase [Dichotomicrobium thermohalophilum]|nr:N-formylglutamate amidohydrolase [Dichotomicrobium thermohalophilum]
MSRFMTPARWLEREIHCIHTELDPPFAVEQPAALVTPFIFNSPHSGRIYPSIFIKTAQLSPQALRMSEDLFIDKLFAPVIDKGATLMSACFPRAYLDLNRQPYELDPALFAEKLPDYANSSSLRVIGGLGTIPRLVNENEEIYAAPLPLSVGLARVERLYQPYHDTLSRLIEDTRNSFGRAFLIDCHSMPSHLGEAPGAPPYDIVLGDRFGGSCSRDLVDFAATTFSMMGYHVGLNKPYAGGHITEFYGRPADCIHALQIEINRGLYVCEKTFEIKPGFAKLKEDIAELAERLITRFSPGAQSLRTAAE